MEKNLCVNRRKLEKSFFRKMLMIMRLTILLILMTLGQSIAAQSYLQNVRLNLNLKNASIETVISQIEEKTDFYFLYNKKIVDVDRKVNIHVENKKITEVLDNLFSNTNVYYSIVNRQIVLSSKEAMQQPKDVSGKLTDSSGSPLPGVTVVIKGTTQGTITDTDGNYKLSDIPFDATLVFSFVGMQTREIPVTGKTTIDVTMFEESIGIDEVVAIGYGTMKKSDLTGSVASVSSEKLSTLKVISPEQSLSGRIAGVQVTQQSSAPGGGVSIRIRGGNSVNGDNEPLYVIDGFPVAPRSAGTSGMVYPSSLANINSNDIESIEVLKDASATAIYGSRGANGVILITTKKGKSGAAQLTFDSYYGVQQVSKKLDLMNAEQYAIFANESAEQRGVDPYFSNPSSLGKGTDWQDEIYRAALTQNYELSVSGGHNKTNYFVSGNYFDQEGIIKNSRYRRYSVRMNMDSGIGDRIKIGTTFTGSHGINNQMKNEEGNGGAQGVVRAAVYFLPYLTPYNEDGTYTQLPRDGTAVNAGFPADNPVALINETKNDITSTRLLGNMYGQLNLAKGLYLKVSFGADLESQLYQSYYTRQVTSGNGQRYDGVAGTTNLTYLNWLNENTLTYSTDIRGEHSLNVLLGYTRQKEDVKRHQMGDLRFQDDLLGYDGIGQGNNPGGPSARASHGQWQLASWLARVNYKFKDKYLLTLSARADGSSRLGKNNRWGFFPSGAVAWNIFKEGFMEDVHAIQNLKLRASYGLTGNTGVGAYSTIPRLATTSYTFDDNKVIAYLAGGLPNGDLRWESTAQFDVGLDVGFLDGRIWLTADYYVKNTTDLLLSVTIPSSTGFTSTTKNTGKMQNKGLELTLGATVLDSPLSWETSLNWSTNKNKLVSLGESAPFPEDQVVGLTYVDVGHPLGTFYGYVSDGIINDQAEADASPRVGDVPGDLKFVDTNGDGEFNADDRTYIGSPYPDFIFGWNNTFRYKAFSLTAFIQGSVGNDVFNTTKARTTVLGKSSDLNQPIERFTDRWTPENPNGTQPRAGWTAGLWPIGFCLEDGSYARLKSLQLGYDIPIKNTKLVKKAFVYVSGQNLLTITKYTGYNPDVNSIGTGNLFQGIDMGAYPLAKSYLFGVKVEF